MAATFTRWPEARVAEAVRLVAEMGMHAAAERLGCSRPALRSMFRDRALPLPAPPPGGVLVPAQRKEEPCPRSSGGEQAANEAPRIYVPPAPPIIPVGKDLLVSLVGDLHAPDEDRPAWNACLRWHAENQPDVIVLNEIGEWQSMTHHGGNWGAKFEDDIRATRRKLVQVRSICPNATIKLLETNHDTRMRRLIADLLPQLAGYLAIPKELKLDDLGIDWIPETVPFRIGRLKVIHGHQLSNTAKGMLPENACKRAIQRFGEPGWTVVFFHTHREGYWMERHDSGTFEAVNISCLRTLSPDWTAPSVTGWQHGFGIAHIGPAGQTNLYSARIEHGSFRYGGKRYSGEMARAA